MQASETKSQGSEEFSSQGSNFLNKMEVAVVENKGREWVGRKKSVG